MLTTFLHRHSATTPANILLPKLLAYNYAASAVSKIEICLYIYLYLLGLLIT